MVSRREKEEQEAKTAEAAERAEKTRARKEAANTPAPATDPVVDEAELDPAFNTTARLDEKGPRVSPNPDFRPGERLDARVDDPRLANENTRRDQVEAALSQKMRDTTLYPPTEAEIARQQARQKELDKAAARDAAETQFHRKLVTEELGTGIDGLLQVLYRRGLVSISEIEAITGKDIPEAEEIEMEAARGRQIKEVA